MTKKTRKTKKSLTIEPEPFEARIESTEAEESQIEPTPSEVVSQAAGGETPESNERLSGDEAVLPENDESTSDESSKVDEDSADSLLDDVRQSLIEDETVKDEKKSKKWWRRVAKGLQKDKKAELEMPGEAEANLTPLDVQADLSKEKEEKRSEEYLDEIDELIDMLEAESSEEPAQAAETVVTPVEPEVDIEELKKQAFRPRDESEEQENITEVRSVALEDGEEVFVEVEAKPQDPLEERLAAFENTLRPYRRYVYFGFAVLGVVMAVIAGAVLLNVYRQSRPATPVVDPNLPFPTSISLPGGLNFSLGKGVLQNGEWNPHGPEWLQGTEICRWVAIPWSRQLEAVIRTLNPDDEINLVMSNNDQLVYKVYSIQQLSNEELQKLPSDSPCLLLVLAKADSDMRWVLTALP